MFSWINNIVLGINSFLFEDRIKEAYNRVRGLVDLEGQQFADFLKDHGFEEGVIDRYMREYCRSKGQTYREYRQQQVHDFFEDLLKKPQEELKKALSVLGLKNLPEDRKVARAAHRRIVRLWHPDLCNLPGAEEKVTEVNNAWEVISKYYQDN